MIVEIMKKGRPDIVNDGEQSLWPVNYAEYPVYKAWEIIRMQTKHPPSPERLVMQLIVLQQGEEGIFEEPQYYFVYPSKENPGKAVWERVTSRYFYCELDDRKRAIRPNPVVYWQREDSIYYYRINQVVGEKFPECNEKWRIIEKCVVSLNVGGYTSRKEDIFLSVLYDTKDEPASKDTPARHVIAHLGDTEFKNIKDSRYCRAIMEILCNRGYYRRYYSDKISWNWEVDNIFGYRGCLYKHENFRDDVFDYNEWLREYKATQKRVYENRRDYMKYFR